MLEKAVTISVDKAIDNVSTAIVEAYESVNDYVIEIGVVSGKSHRQITADITNAELMFIHEHGSPLRGLPARPVLELSIREAVKTYVPQTMSKIEDGCFNKGWTKEQVRIELEKMCLRMQTYARQIIYKSNLLAANKPSTIKAKGSDRPLLNTGQLARSITCRLSRIKE